jgi:hypothetical protein
MTEKNSNCFRIDFFVALQNLTYEHTSERQGVSLAMRNESKSHDVLSRAISFHSGATVIFLSVKLMYNWTTIIVFSF